MYTSIYAYVFCSSFAHCGGRFAYCVSVSRRACAPPPPVAGVPVDDRSQFVVVIVCALVQRHSRHTANCTS